MSGATPPNALWQELKRPGLAYILAAWVGVAIIWYWHGIETGALAVIVALFAARGGFVTARGDES